MIRGCTVIKNRTRDLCLVISRIDKDGSLSVEWEEFRNFMQLAPSGDLEDIVMYWRQNLVSKAFGVCNGKKQSEEKLRS